ncbi:MAG: PA14 domain-containing protein [Bacteroidia bacterium]
MKWANGRTQPEYTLFAPQGGASLQIIYEAVPVGNGPGLPGAYYNDPELDLDGEPVFERIDSVIDFRWGNSSPHSSITKDYFTVRWQGEIQSIYEDEYTFYIRSDDGARLWIGDSLVIDNWVAQAPKEVSETSIPAQGANTRSAWNTWKSKADRKSTCRGAVRGSKKRLCPSGSCIHPQYFTHPKCRDMSGWNENGNYARDLTEPDLRT